MGFFAAISVAWKEEREERERQEKWNIQKWRKNNEVIAVRLRNFTWCRKREYIFIDL